VIDTVEEARQRAEALVQLVERQPVIADALLESRLPAFFELSQIGKCIRKFQIDLVIDCGANSGQYSGGVLGYNGFKGEIVAFEPVRKFYDLLCVTFDYWKAQAKLTAVHAAVGETPGIAKINVGAGHGGTSSMLGQTELLGKLAAGSHLSGETEDVEVVRIDQYFANVDMDARRCMLKMDVQGYEMSVLRSCGDKLRKFKLIQSELSGLSMYQNQTTPKALFSFMEDNGFAPICLLNNFNNEDKSIYYDFDVIFAQREEISSF
jgi:FkbM family methyltransferase